MDDVPIWFTVCGLWFFLVYICDDSTGSLTPPPLRYLYIYNESVNRLTAGPLHNVVLQVEPTPQNVSVQIQELAAGSRGDDISLFVRLKSFVPQRYGQNNPDDTIT